MNNELTVLYITAASIAFVHTIIGPDHYLPFIVMGRARKWPLLKTGLLTVICGIGHIMSSVILGILGIILGIGVMKLEVLESFRGNLAGWLLIGFGFAYFIWGLRRILKNKSHEHFHAHMDWAGHSHSHSHMNEHAHVHDKDGKKNITPWVLFTIFILGPCEPLIPILMYPAVKNSIAGLVAVTGIFAVVTIITMFGAVMLSSLGINFIPLGRFERYKHILAGTAIFISGLAVQFLGL